MKNDYRPSFGLRRIKIVIVCAFVTVLIAHHPIAGAQQVGGVAPPPLVTFAAYEASASPSALSAGGAATLETIQSDPAASEIRIGSSAPDAVLEAHALSLALPPGSRAPGSAADTAIVFTNISVEYNEEGLASLYARDEEADSEVSLVIDGPDVLGSIRHGAELYKVHPLGDGTTAVYLYDTSQLRPHPENWEEFLLRQVPDAPPSYDTGTPGAAADTGDEIDILVVYTQGAKAAAGNVDAFIQFAIDNTHRIYSNTDIGLRLRLVHKYEARYTQNSDLDVDLDRLTYTSDRRFSDGTRPDPDGHMDEVHDLRDRYGADLVVLIVARRAERYCGFGWIPRYTLAYNYAYLGFSVVAQNCETLTHHTFAHEIGHNQGATHDPDNANFSAFPYGHGLCNTDDNWNTVMAYSSNQQGDCIREISYFSSPIITYNGAPTGDAEVRDNRRVLMETKYRVANFRESVIQQPQNSYLHHPIGHAGYQLSPGGICPDYQPLQSRRDGGHSRHRRYRPALRPRLSVAGREADEAFQLRGPGKRERIERVVRGSRGWQWQLATGACHGAGHPAPGVYSDR